MEKETIIKTDPQNSENLKVKGVTKKQLKLLQNGKLPLAVLGGLVAGIGSQYAFAKISDVEDEDIPEDELIDDANAEFSDSAANDEELFDFEAPTTIAFSDNVTDDMSFGEAFGAARSEMGPGGFFNWRGSSYHTLNKEEWDALTPDERDEYTQKIKDNTNFEDGKYNKVEPDETDELDIVPDEEKNSDDKNEDDEGNDEKDSDDNHKDKTEDNEKNEGEDADMIIPEDEQEFADLDEIITEDELLADLNQEEVIGEEDGSEGGIIEEESDDEFLEDLNNDSNNVEYDSDFGDDLIQGSENLDEMDLDLD